jgi:hypothetical protein
MFKIPKTLWLTVVALAVLAGLLAPPTWAASARLVVHLNEPFEVNGHVYQPGRLSLQQVREYSPIATLNEIRVDGRSLGVVLAREETGAPQALRDEVIFQRNESGRLVLASVALKGEPVRKLYTLGAGDDAGPWQAMTQPRPTMIASTQ